MTEGGSQVWHRSDAISHLRKQLLAMTNDEHSLCQVAAERGIFCRGFRRWNEGEFDRRWRKYIGRSTHLSRSQMEEYANLWELAEQIRKRVSLACDAQTACGPCRGWNEFSNAELARFCNDVLGENVDVVE
jgi:hypothetical protein